MTSSEPTEAALAQLDAMVLAALRMDLERIRPELPCGMCRDGEPCAWHRPMFNQTRTQP